MEVKFSRCKRLAKRCERPMGSAADRIGHEQVEYLSDLKDRVQPEWLVVAWRIRQ